MRLQRLTVLPQPIFSPRPAPALQSEIPFPDPVTAGPAANDTAAVIPDAGPPAPSEGPDAVAEPAPRALVTLPHPAPPPAPPKPRPRAHPIFGARPKMELTRAIPETPAPPKDHPIFSPRPGLTLQTPKAPVAAVTVPEAPDLPEVISLGRLLSEGRWRTEAMRAYSRPVLYWFTRGQGRATVAGSTRGFAPHNAFLLPPGVMHGFDLIGQVSGAFVRLPRALVDIWPEEPTRLPLRTGQEQMELTARIDALRAEGETRDAWRATALDHQARLLAIWLRRAAGAVAERREGSAADLSAAFCELVETTFAQGAGIAAYAEKLGVTPTHLSRVCRKTSGRPALEILRSRRLYEAQRLLAESDLPVAEVAGRAGFASPAYFSRAFRQATGQAPSDFRESAASRPTNPTS